MSDPTGDMMLLPNPVYVIVYGHRHGTDVLPVTADKKPTFEECVEYINTHTEFEEDRDEWIEVYTLLDEDFCDLHAEIARARNTEGAVGTNNNDE